MPRGARLDAPGTLHHVIVRGIEKRQVVDDDDDRTDFVKRLEKLSIETKTQIFSWALMSNHVHLLLKSSTYGLSRFMRRLLTGYAVRYNRRHDRHGHLFQNRYKSIVCEEDTYFKELVRYIHLNPLRAGLVPSIKALEKYRWCGHGAILGTQAHDWVDRKYVLGWFGPTEAQAKADYRRFVEKGAGLGSQPELVGGGLIRSMGGWSHVLSMRKLGLREKSDERILGSGDFVESLMEESDERIARQFAQSLSTEQIHQIIVTACERQGVSIIELKGGSRRAPVSALRASLIFELIEHHGLTPAEVARQLGVTISAVSKTISRNRK